MPNPVWPLWFAAHVVPRDPPGGRPVRARVDRRRHRRLVTFRGGDALADAEHLRSRPMTASTMQDFPLTITAILRHGAGVRRQRVRHVDRRRRAPGDVRRGRRQRRPARGRAHEARACEPGDRVGTFCWNTQEHLEAYFAVPCMGAVLHTLNIRLFPEQLAYVDQPRRGQGRHRRRHARAGARAASSTSCRRSSSSSSSATATRRALGDREVLRYDELLAAEQPGFEWPELDERPAAAMCYTSGTTGNPKGVVYSHRSTYLHSLVAHDADRARPLRARPRAARSCRCSTRTRGACRTRRSCAARRS